MMKPYPHIYGASAHGTAEGVVSVSSEGLPALDTTPPPEFGGPPGYWSPETLLTAAVADCFVLSFRGVARAAGFKWQKLDCEVEATLERVEGVTRFSRFLTRASLVIPAGADEAKAGQLLERAARICLVANSLHGEQLLEASVVVA